MRNDSIGGKSPKRKRKHILLIVLLFFALVILVLRMLLPDIVLKYLNKQLHDLREYTGNIKDIDIRLYRGAYIAKSLVIDKLDEDGKKDTIPFFRADRIDLSIDWHALTKGRIKGRIRVLNPVIKYTSEVTRDKELKKDTADFREIIKKLMPLTVNKFEVKDGQIHFVDPNVKPAIDISMTDVYITATNLTNVEKSNELLPSRVTAGAYMYDGNFNMDIKLDPLNRNPTFEMQCELKNMDLTKLNPFFETYGNIEVEKGRFSLFSEFAGKEGKFGGYVKPFIEDFKVDKYNKDEDLKERIWETVVGTVMKILKNPKTDQVATKIPVEGQFNNAEVNVWKAIHYVLRNAFVQALRPAIENSISVNDLKVDSHKTLLEKVFGGNDKEDKKEEKERKK